MSQCAYCARTKKDGARLHEYGGNTRCIAPEDCVRFRQAAYRESGQEAQDKARWANRQRINTADPVGAGVRAPVASPATRAATDPVERRSVGDLLFGPRPRLAETEEQHAALSARFFGAKAGDEPDFSPTPPVTDRVAAAIAELEACEDTHDPDRLRTAIFELRDALREANPS